MKRPVRAAPLDIAPSVNRDAVVQGLHGWLKRMALSVAGGSFAATVCAGADAGWARASIDGTRAPSFVALARTETGLVAPLGLAIGVVVGMIAFVLEPDRARSPKELWQTLALVSRARRDRLVGFFIAAGLGLPLWATTVANWAKSAMASPASNYDGGLAMAALAFGLFCLMLAAALAVGELFAPFARAASPEVPLAHALVAGLSLTLVLIVLGVKIGTTSGGGGWLGIWGVMKRPELDLRALTLVLIIVLGAYLLPHLIQRTPRLAVGLALAPLAFTIEAAMGLGGQPEVAASIEQGAPLGKMCLATLRRMTDGDHDGYSAFFGGGDCDDHDPRINPAAQEIPGNGVDEDCSGIDARPPPMPAPNQAHPARKTTELTPKGLSVILITVDTLRADLGFAGNPRPVSPNLDAFAARSVVFDRAYSLASYTGKSLGPLLIGKYPSETHRNWGHFNRFSNEDLFVSERLQKAGIRTVAVHAHWYMSGAFGLARGYDVVDKSAQPPPGTDQDNDATVTGAGLTDAALRVLSNPDNTSKRFFAWIHFLDPHSEYARHPGAPDFGTGSRAAYDGEVWYTDHQIGRLLAFVGSQPWAAQTAILVTSDHGEAFGEHHMIRHGMEIWEELVRVPLLAYVPKAVPHHVTPPRSGIDLVPTILELFEMPLPDGSRAFDFVSGHSLLEDIALPAGYEPAERDVLVDMPAGPYNDERRALIRGQKKLYVANSVRYTLFDLENDPAEKNASDDKDLLADMKARYQEQKSQLREVPVKPVPKESSP